MEIEKHLYRVSERTLKRQNMQIYCCFIFVTTLIITINFALLFSYGTFYLINHNNSFQNCLIQSQLKYKSDEILDFYFQEIPGLNLINIQPISSTEHCKIYKDINIDQRIFQAPVEYIEIGSVLSLSIERRQLFRFHNYTIFLKYGIGQKSFLDPKTVLINQLIQIIHKQNKQQKYAQFKVNGDRSIGYNYHSNQIGTFDKLYLLGKIIVCYLLISIATSMYIYGTIVSAPAVIILMLGCFRTIRPQNMVEVYRIFPWIGLPVLIRQTSTNAIVKGTSYVVCAALLTYFIIMYFVYYSIILKTTNLIFQNLSEAGIQQAFCSYIAMIQFASIVFVRTRPFLKYFPRIHTLLMLIFLIYSSFVQYGFKKNLLGTVVFASVTFFCWFIIQAQIPSQTTWNRQHKYTPTIDRPRIGFFPIFNMNWINSLPEQWTRFIPLYGRQNFTQQELTLVDRNFQELNQILQNH